MLQSTPQNSEIANDVNNSSRSSYLTKNPMNAAQLSVKNVSWAPKHKSSNVLFSTTFELNAGNILGIVGPNGAEKPLYFDYFIAFTSQPQGLLKSMDRYLEIICP